MVSIKEQIVVITGASSGIGAACAKLFAQEGASLSLAARRRDNLEAVATEIEQAYQSKIYLLEMDVCDRN
ncbi:MAG: SDR family NAD(P)-dependent oxidoreductase, partial [Pleurocapsa sp.]